MTDHLEQERHRQRASQVVALTDRFGDWYRIWWDASSGLFWAEGYGDKLSADSATSLAYVIADHMALVRDRKARAAAKPGEGRSDRR